MSQTQSYDYLTTAVHNEYLHIAGCNPTSPKVLVTFEAEEQLPSQPTLEHVDDVSTTQLEPLGEQELAYIRTEEFAKDDMLARLGLDLGLDVPDGGSLPKLALNIPPQPSEPSTPDPPFPLCNETAKALAEFDAMAYMAALDVPLPTSVGWEEGPRPSLHGSGVIDMSFAVPHTTPWSSWPEISANEGLNSQGSATNALSPEIVIPTLSQQLFLGPQDHAINSNPTSLQPPQTGRPRARTVPTVFREVTPDPAPSFPLGSPISVPHTPHNLFSSEGGSSTSSSPFSQSHDLPPCGNHPSSSFNPRFRSASVSTASRGRPLTRPRGIVERALNPARVRAHLPTHTDLSQGPTPGGVSSTSQHLDVPSSDWFCGGSDVSDYVPDSPSTPSNLSRASSTSSVHRRPRSHSRSNTPYTKPSSGVTVGDGSIGNLGPGNSSPERPKPNKNRKRNGREEFPGQRLHFDEQFMETVLGDNLALRMLLDNVLRSSWRKDHILEPSYGAQDDGVSQGLNLPIEPGSSVLLAFVHKTGDEHTCILCREVVSPRIPRQLGHVRGHIDLRPFPCTGCDSCDPKFPGRFFSRDLLQDHHRSSKSGKCHYCGEKMRQHNLKRHIQAKHHQFTGGVPYIRGSTTQWETTAFHHPPTLEPYGMNGHCAKIPSSSKGHSRISSAG